jgi:hypothetical protein
MTRNNRTESLSWLVPAYGAPTRSSEVSRIEGFYSVEALTAFGGPPLAADDVILPEDLPRAA